MRRIIFFALLIISTAQAQTYTTAKLSEYQRSQWKTNDSFRIKQAVKDVNDDRRNFKIDSLGQIIALILSENKKLKERLDSAASYYNPDQFSYDSDTKTISIKPDAFMIVPKGVVQFGFKPLFGVAAGMDNMAMSPELKPLGKEYTIGTNNLSPKDQDISDLKWQIDYFEKLLDDDKKIMDNQLKTIKKQQKIIDKIKK